MKFELPKIYPITDTALSGFSHVEQVKRLIAGGAAIIQLRDKSASALEFYRSAAEVLKIARKSNVRIIINDRVDIALALKADGVHLGQDDLPANKAREILGPDAVIGVSAHTAGQARAAIESPVNYIAIGPIFPTSTKKNAEKTVGLDGLKAVRDTIGNMPLVAIGGISKSNVSDVLANGADSAAIISDLYNDPENISEKLRIITNIINIEQQL